jgi:hypothetical protein
MPFVLIIQEQGSSWAGRGPIAQIHPTREDAHAELIDYVRENWDAKMDIDPPEDEDDLVEAYFDCVLEEYIISEAVETTSSRNAAP